MEPVYDINEDVKREVLAATDLVDLIGAVTALKKVGASWKGLCPFHGEKTPSFYVHPEKGFYYCFGCGAKGDAITFVRETERLEFPEAVAYLARRAGISLPVRRAGTRSDRAKDNRPAEALAAAAAFFSSQLERHADVRALLSRRGVTAEEARRFGFGAAPDSWEALKEALSGRFPEEVLLEVGLLQRSEAGRVYDRFRNRLTIEIRDARGEVLGFGARALGDEPPKYLNSPESSRFTKGRLLYGLDRAREAIRKGDEAILVEGYFDRIAMERAGLPQAVASMGTALTPAQADLLARHAAGVVVAYDGDPPGQAASRKAFPLLLERGVKVRHLVLPGGHDPDSFLAANGAEALRALVEAAPGIVSALALMVPPPGSDPAERAERIQEAAGILRAAPDRVLRHELLSGLARASAVPLETLFDPSDRRAAIARKPAPEADRPIPLPEAEEVVLGYLLADWPARSELVPAIPAGSFSHPSARSIFGALQELARTPEPLDFLDLASHLEVAAGRTLHQIVLEPRRPGPAEREDERFEKALGFLGIRLIERESSALQPEIARAEASGDADRVRELLEEKQRQARNRQGLRRRITGPGGSSQGGKETK